jgi:carbonic anhydrase
VVPELLTSTAPGQLFVVRNVANLIPPLEHADASVGAALEYAVAHLEVPAIVVCGHDGCGGIKGALEADPGISALPSLREWLQGAQPAVDAVAHLPPEERLRAAVEQNVLLQMDNLLTYPAVEAAVEAGRLEVHGWVYDMHSFGLRVYDEDQGIFLPVHELLAG